jgi:hypothetical protein
VDYLGKKEGEVKMIVIEDTIEAYQVGQNRMYSPFVALFNEKKISGLNIKELGRKWAKL